jgi:hypothetical protein
MGAAMPDYREINAIQKDPARARTLAQHLCKLEDIAWTDWELDFLENISGCRDELSTRQGEKLIELRDETVWYTAVDGFSLKTLIDRCHLCRDELREDDAAFIARLKEARTTKLRRKDARRLLRCARTLGEIEPHQGGVLESAPR